MKELIRMNRLAGLITEGQARKMLAVLNEDEYQESVEKFPASNFKLIKKVKDADLYLLNDEIYTTSSGLKLNLKTFGTKNSKTDYFSYIYTDVFYNNKKLTKGSGISGLNKFGRYDVAGSINKAKKWLDINGDAFSKGEKQFEIPST